MLKNVQALRAAAALLVVLDHINGELPHDASRASLFRGFGYVGNFGVDLFFAISGFIMLVTTWDRFGRPGESRSFLLRRVVRIYPPYWLVLAPIVVTYAAASHTLMRSHAGHADVLSSLLLLPQANTPLLVSSWTLVFEMYFYLVFAVVIALPRRYFFPSLGIWLLFEIAMSSLFAGTSNPYVGFLASPLAIEFVLGTLVGYAYVTGRVTFAAPAAALGASIALAVWIANGLHLPTADLAKNDMWRVIQFGVPAAAIVYGVVGLERRGRLEAPAWSVALGDASYAIYLWHVPVTIVLGALANRVRLHGAIADAAVQIATIGVVIGLGLVVYRAFERPVTRYLNANVVRRLTGPRATAPVSGIALAEGGP